MLKDFKSDAEMFNIQTNGGCCNSNNAIYSYLQN